MICPEVWNFPTPKVVISQKQHENWDSVFKTFEMNNFYKSLVVTCPDEIQVPSTIEEIIAEDNDYYKITNCSLTEFLEPTFIESFVKKGNIYCLSVDRNCMVQNCAAITPDGNLIIHVLNFIYQTLGLEGTKRPHDFYELKIDLKNLKHVDKLKHSLSKLESFDFHVIWEPDSDEICPSSIAKYFNDRGLCVSVHVPEIRRISPSVAEIPSVIDTEPSEMVEWIGMLAHGGDLCPTETYISTYSQPESDSSLKSTRITLLISKSFITPLVITKICQSLSEFVASRELDNYWASLSIQSNENSLWQWNTSSPKMFQAHNSSCTVFVSKKKYNVFSIGELKYT